MNVDQKIEANSVTISLPLRLLGVAAAVSVALIAIFPLAEWAETAAWHHAAQHVMIFSAGLASALAVLGRRGTKESK